MHHKHQILIIGGGNAGISVAAQLLRKRPHLDIAILDPADKHYYQPAWTLVGGGDFDAAKTVRSQASVMPAKVKWIKEAVAEIKPGQNELLTENGNTYSYDFLVATPGIQLDWHKIPGLKETLGKNGVTSNYSFETAPYTFECIKALKDGSIALFTNPATPIKCGGAPQKIMYMAADYCKKNGIKANIQFRSAGAVIFGVKKYAAELLKMVDKYGISLNLKHELVAIDGKEKKATFKIPAGVQKPEHIENLTPCLGVDTNISPEFEFITLKFDMIHVTPPQSAPDFIKRSPLADPHNPLGWIEVDKHSLRHVRFANVFACGDATNTPNAKTGAAIRKQAPVLVQNLLNALDNAQPSAQYEGYGSCPLVVGYNKLILAEFDYQNEPTETFPFNQAKPRWSMYTLKKHALPWLYWNQILKGKA